MENNQPQLNEHNKTEYPPMHTCEFNIQLINRIEKHISGIIYFNMFHIISMKNIIFAYFNNY